MKTGYATARAQAGAVSAILVGITGLVGFAAGALVMGLVALSQDPETDVAARVVVPASNRAVHEAPEPTFYQVPDGPAVTWPQPWPYEAAARKRADAPGPKRPDRLSAPEGWTQEAAGKTE